MVGGGRLEANRHRQLLLLRSPELTELRRQQLAVTAGATLNKDLGTAFLLMFVFAVIDLRNTVVKANLHATFYCIRAVAPVASVIRPSIQASVQDRFGSVSASIEGAGPR